MSIIDGDALINHEGLSWNEWRYATGRNFDEEGQRALFDARQGWQKGEDPTEWKLPNASQTTVVESGPTS